MAVIRQTLDDFTETLFNNEAPYKILERQLGPSVGNYRKKWHLAGEGKLELEYPLHLNIELVYGCNLECGFCAYSRSTQNRKNNARRGKRISFEKYCEIVDDGVEHGLCAIALNGYNEPLTQRDIAKYVEYARKAGIVDVSLHTNATLLTGPVAQSLIDADMSIIMFSIDAFTKETYEKIRKGAVYEEMMANIERFLELKKASAKVLPLTRVSFVKNKVNRHELDAFIAFWGEKVDYIMLQGFNNPLVDDRGHTEMHAEYHLDDAPFTKCFQPYQRLFVASNGDVLPCCSYYGLSMPVGNIYEGSIYNIWNCEEMKELRTKVNRDACEIPKPCQKCRRGSVKKS